MLEIAKDIFRARMQTTLKALEKKKYEPYFKETAGEARDLILELVRGDETVGVGGSLTLREGLGVVQALKERGNTVWDHWDNDGDPARRLALKRQQRQADVFLSGLNALTLDGIMVNLDGGGNRVAGTCSGPKTVIVVAGANKLTDSLDAAIDRTQKTSAPPNAMRLKKNTPCAATGICNDCSSPERICAALLVLFKKPGDIDRFVVILVNEEMGY